MIQSAQYSFVTPLTSMVVTRPDEEIPEYQEYIDEQTGECAITIMILNTFDVPEGIHTMYISKLCVYYDFMYNYHLQDIVCVSIRGSVVTT